ncbi:hypothetical protein P7C71_g853, partial [Lecanoromycetidae sp. Uapishka_2]
MAALRVYPVFRSIRTIQPTRSLFRATLPSAYAQQHRFYAGSSYGGGDGDPKGESPQDQGSNPSAHLEHPGPPPPDVGKGTGGGPTKAGGEGHNTQQNQSSGSQASSSGGGGAQPKIHKHDAPGEQDHSDDVKAHNKDMDQRHDRATEKSPDKDDKVDKGFWAGQGGADKDP